MPSRQNEVGLETSNPPTVESVETPGLSAARRAQAERLLNQYGTEEGLRRLREMDPDAARRFERERRGMPSRGVPKADGYSDGQSPDSAP